MFKKALRSVKAALKQSWLGPYISKIRNFRRDKTTEQKAAENYVDLVCDELLWKRSGLLAHKETLTTLALGSSHGHYCFDPEYLPNSYNFCAASQDLMHSLFVYEYAIKTVPHLRNIVLFYSHFSPRFALAKCGEKLRCVAYKELLGYTYEYTDQDINTAYERIKGSYKTKTLDTTAFGFEKTNDRFYFKNMTGAERANQHMPYTTLGTKEQQFADQNGYLESIIKLANKTGHNLTIIISPLRSDLRHALPPKEILYQRVYELYNANDPSMKFNLLDYHSECPDEDFGDMDHLLSASDGPRKLMESLAPFC